jgi:uncharacterized protein (DUF58 family)
MARRSRTGEAPSQAAGAWPEAEPTVRRARTRLESAPQSVAPAPVPSRRRPARQRIDEARAALAPTLETASAIAGPAWRRVRLVTDCVTPLGWTVLVLGRLGWGLAHWLGWQECAIVATAALALVVLAALFTIGRMRLAVTLEVTPRRVSVGTASMAHFEVVNTSRGPLFPLGVELPVGVSAARYTTPLLGPGEPYDDWVTIPTSQRGVVLVGPVRTQRGDPFGMIRRQVVWTDSVELFIHPAIVGIDELGTGLLRDLEGQTTQDISASDLAFHALREYVPGDDQRYIHWKSSARLTAITGEPTFLIRQFMDTRRSHILVVTDVDPVVYAEQDEFETALSCAASVAVRALMDAMDVSLICGSQRVARPAPHVALDTYSRAIAEPITLADAVARLDDIAGDASIAVLVTGESVPFEQLLRSRVELPVQVRMVVVRVAKGAAIRRREAGGFTEVTVGSLSDLPRALRGGVLV